MRSAVDAIAVVAIEQVKKGDRIWVQRAGGRNWRLAEVTKAPWRVDPVESGGRHWDVVPFSYVHRWSGAFGESLGRLDHLAVIGQDKIRRVIT